MTTAEGVQVTDGSGYDEKPFWSPDGNLLYFLSSRDGFLCLWAQRLDPSTKHPLGDQFEVQPFHQSRYPLVWSGGVGMWITRDRAAFAMRERTGNIWLAEPEEGQRDQP